MDSDPTLFPVPGRRTVESMSDEDWLALRLDAEALFTPGTAIKEQDLFAGRSEQIQKLAQRIRLAGSHAVVYGERGVGKSSLVNIFRFIADASPSRVQYIRVSATNGDTYKDLFIKIFKRINNEKDGTISRLSDRYESRSISPDDVLLEFENFSNAATPIIVIDEFDKLVDDSSKALVSDTIKLLSDEGANVTFFIVGVSDAVGQLMRGHESIGRALAEIEMPRMSDQEIVDIVNQRLKRAGLRIMGDALWDVVFVTKGLPHYAHLLGLHAMQAACDRKTLTITRTDVASATKLALGEANQSIREAFERAIYSERPDNIFTKVLLACALAEKDRLGRFNAKAVAQRLEDLTGEKYSIPAFSYHLNEFCDPGRSAILEKAGRKRQFTYRFIEALMEPYTILEGIERGLVSGSLVERFRPRRQGSLFPV